MIHKPTEYLQSIPWESPITNQHCLHLDIREEPNQSRMQEKALPLSDTMLKEIHENVIISAMQSYHWK